MTCEESKSHPMFSRRSILLGATGAIGLAASVVARQRALRGSSSPVIILKARHYTDDLRKKLLSGLAELGIKSRSIVGKKVLLKPNLVEPSHESEHVNTHPLLIQAAIESFRSLGAASVTVAEGAGHVRDPYFVLEESGLLEPLLEDRTEFIDLNFAPVTRVQNQGHQTTLTHLIVPQAVVEADFVVSMAKMKTHHWTGATLSMKNLFGIMPGSFYGWPKNVLHHLGITESILDINSTIRPALAIVDGIIGMGGDGPIMGTPVNSNVIVMGANLPAVDATCARIMMLNPDAIPYLNRAQAEWGSIHERHIDQRGERISAVQSRYPLLDFVPAMQNLRLVRQHS